MENVLEALKKTFKTKNTQNKEVLNLWRCDLQTLRGSVVEHRRAESEDLSSDSHGDSEFFLVPRS